MCDFHFQYLTRWGFTFAVVCIRDARGDVCATFHLPARRGIEAKIYVTWDSFLKFPQQDKDQWLFNVVGERLVEEAMPFVEASLD